MLKLGCCMSMMARTADGLGLENLPMLAEHGFDYVDVSLAHFMALPESERQRVKAALSDSGLPCEACNNFFPARYRLTGPSADHGAALRYAAEAVRAARSLGAEVIVFGSSKPRNVPHGFSRERAWDQLVSFAREVGEIAGEHDVTIAMEHLNRSESNILTSFSENIRFVREAAHPRIRALVDLYHVSLEKEPIEDLLQGEGLLAHAHIAHLTGRTWPVAATEDLRAFFNTLKAIGYEGRVSVEAYSDDVGADSKEAMRVLRALTR